MTEQQKCPFSTEVELCKCFSDSVASTGEWLIYPETEGFDVLLIERTTGHQLGVQAKLRLNAKLADQILPDRYYDGRGVDWRAVIVPPLMVASGLERLLNLVGIMVWQPRRRYFNGDASDWSFAGQISDTRFWYDWNPIKRCKLPEFIPQVPAGAPSPIQLTPWKVGALRVMARIEVDGFVTAKEVRECGVDSRRFCCTASGWLRPIGNGRWVIHKIPRFDQQHPETYAEILKAVRESRHD